MSLRPSWGAQRMDGREILKLHFHHTLLLLGIAQVLSFILKELNKIKSLMLLNSRINRIWLTRTI